MYQRQFHPTAWKREKLGLCYDLLIHRFMENINDVRIAAIFPTFGIFIKSGYNWKKSIKGGYTIELFATDDVWYFNDADFSIVLEVYDEEHRLVDGSRWEYVIEPNGCFFDYSSVNHNKDSVIPKIHL